MEERFGSAVEQDVVNLSWVLKRQAADLGGQREHDMEIGNRQQFGGAALEPAGALGVLTLRTVPVTARVVGDAYVGALAALFDMAAESGGATGFDGAHDA